ncbi:glycerol-3-phosphate dehydrogenase [Frankia sp. CcI156]|uniref:glycerol-3-phosphate dehydrogenase/oxidase n=1 Tax=Frankia TaxID=1854 RepID=UPI0003CFF98A|nr:MULTISPECIES: glycerol-3-phosphate dehydrogenase/oxidase [Frankia]ETA01916.1 glycerol-3-phosphate dehydrogenase [Frankia sp. CcI6]OAA24608.1 glycerol-3-phosphate dehydrogenase [Frankia casuarinae]OHV54619.1 glycerol-3-phosphate dehydrogenase [Frankia sp. CgIS1]ONH25810.1 glycerol-3-phosphate dehydrogenase [Frankia sp. CcI156]
MTVLTLPPTTATSLNAGRRERELAAVAAGGPVDLLVIGGGVTGAGVALDAASRGLSVVLAEAHDLAFGTSRWSSKLVHGGLRYLATGDVALARESAVERDILMRHTAPHLVRALPMLTPLTPGVPRSNAALVQAGVWLGDLLRRGAGTPRAVLPGPRRLTAVETLGVAPALREAGLRGGVLHWDGRLVDDARLVVALARTAAGFGARILTRLRVTGLDGGGLDGGPRGPSRHGCRGIEATAVDTLTGTRITLRARTVVNATGVWAPALAPGIRLRPSRGTHLVLRSTVLAGTRAALSLPMPGERNRFALVLPQDDGRVYVGLTDVPVEEVVDVPVPDEDEIAQLLGIVSNVLATPIDPADRLGAFAGLRPLLDTGTDHTGTDHTGTDHTVVPHSAATRTSAARTADLSRRHLVRTDPGGLVTVVGGKLTTYRRMAADAVDAAVAVGDLDAGPCRTRRLGLVGAAPRSVLATVAAPRRLVERYGTEAPRVLALADGDPDLLAPVAEGTPVTGAELLFAVRDEGALDPADLLDRRTRIGLAPADRRAALGPARQLFDHTLTR